MSRTSLETSEIAAQANDGGTLEKNGFHAPLGSPIPSAGRGRGGGRLYGRLVLPFVVAAICGTGAFVVSNYYMTRWYSTSTTIWFPVVGNQGAGGLLGSIIGNGGADATGSVPILGGIYNSPQFGAGTSTAITALDSSRVKGKVMDKLHLAARWHLSPDKAAARFNKNVTYGVDKDGLLSIQADDPNPRLAQQIVNAYVQAMRDVSTQLSISFAHKNLVAVSQKSAAAQAKLHRDENELASLQTRMAENLPLGGAVTSAYADLVTQQTATQAELSATKAELAAQLRTARKTYGDSLALPSSVPFAQGPLEELRKAESDFARISAIYSPNYPGYREAQNRVAQAKQQAKAEMQRQLSATTQLISPDVAGLYVKRESLQARLDYLRQASAARKSDMLSLPGAQIRQADLNRQIALDSTLYTNLAQAVEQAELAEKRDVPNFEIIDAAGVPGKPSLPRVGYTTALAAMAGFLLTLAWLTARVLLRQPTSQAQIRRWTDTYGLTDGEEEHEALRSISSAALPEYSSPRLPSANANDPAQPDEAERQATNNPLETRPS